MAQTRTRRVVRKAFAAVTAVTHGPYLPGKPRYARRPWHDQGCPHIPWRRSPMNCFHHNADRSVRQGSWPLSVYDISTENVSGVHLQLGDITFYRAVSRRGYHVSWQLPPDYTVLVCCASGTLRIDQDFPEANATIHEGAIVRLAPGIEFTTLEDCDGTVCAIPSQWLSNYLGARTTARLGDPATSRPILQSKRRAKVLMRRVVHTALRDTKESFLSCPGISSHTRNFLAATLNIGNDENDGEFADDGAPEAVPGIVHRAETYLRAHADQQITLEQLAEVAGCRPRSLQEAFRKFRNVTPMTLLRDIRLEYAHEDLLLSDASTSVTDIAAKWGFSNPGRFSRSYWIAYGSYPKDIRKLALETE